MHFSRTYSNVVASVIATVALIALPSIALGQASPEDLLPVALSVDSGPVENLGARLDVVWSETVRVPDAPWLRLTFDRVVLSGDIARGDNAYLIITSELDGHSQFLHAEHIEQWQYTSAYFNGDAVTIDLYAHPKTGPNQVAISEVWTQDMSVVSPRTICGSTDDRILSYDNRAGRLEPGGCTAWMIDDCNHCFLTAGHCIPSRQVVEFNVPLSSPSGAKNHPGPDDQYTIDQSSLQSNGGQGIGNDYAYFGVYPNTNTGLTPAQAYGAWFTLVPPPTSALGIRITGYGSVSSPVSMTWNYVQKTHVGTYMGTVGTELRYATDTTGGNSGSPVILANGVPEFEAIGIHTHGGCNSFGGFNHGTASTLSGLQNALANPQGVCVCQPPQPGDLNCDGIVNAGDIDPFVMALTDPAGYASAYPTCDVLLADVNADGAVNAADIDPFVALVVGP